VSFGFGPQITAQQQLKMRSAPRSGPLGLGIGQVIKQEKTVYNVFVEPQGSVADHGPGQPRWQIFLGLNLQFLN